MDPDYDFRPNHIPPNERRWCIGLALFLILYGTIGICLDDIPIRPPSKGHLPGVDLHGFPAWIMYLAFITAAANLISVIVDHYDKRNNEINYRRFARMTRIAGLIFFSLAMIMHIIYM